MGSVQRNRQRRKKSRVMGRVAVLTRREFDSLDIDSRAELIRQMVPLALMAAVEEMEREVDEIAGPRYGRKGEDAVYRNGMYPGSVVLAGQRVPIAVPRVHDKGGALPLESYRLLHEGAPLDEQAFRRVLYGISCRNYEAAAEAVPGAIGLSSSTVSRRFVAASSEQLEAFHERDLSSLDIVAIFVDGKTFAEDQMVIAVGITLEGQKVILGFVQTDTENQRSVSQFLQALLDRGLDISKGVLAIIDGAKGLRSALKQVFNKRVVVQRCHWHKRENVVSYLSVGEQPAMRRRLQKAYDRPSYEEAVEALLRIRRELEQRNQSATDSLDEGFEEVLTLHRLGVFAQLGLSLKTTNCLESINSQVEERCGKVDHWQNSNQKHRWLAAALLDIEPRLQPVRAHRYLTLLREAIMRDLNIVSERAALAA
jgi:putative transposase